MNTLCKIAAVGVAALACWGAGGCASEGVDIPAEADLVAEGNKRLAYEVPDDGVVYVYDDDANRLIYTGRVARGQMIAIDTKDDDILVDGRRATEWDLDPDHRLQIYYDERPRIGERRVVVEERTTSYREMPEVKARDTSDDPVEHRTGSWNP